MAFSTIQGSGGAPDSFVGTSGVDSIVIVDSAGNYFLGAQEANDIINVQSTASPLYGGVINNATLKGGQGVDTFTFAAGANGVFFSSNFINLNSENDTFTAGNNNNFLASTIQGGQGNDNITVYSLTTSVVNGNKDVDTITVNATSSTSTVYGGQGNDILATANAAGFTNGTFSGDDGNDRITLGSVGRSIDGSSLLGGEGADTISLAGAGSNLDAIALNGGVGDDTLTGTTANGVLVTLQGGEGADRINSGTGNGAETVIGGFGNDDITLAAGVDRVAYTALGQGGTALAATSNSTISIGDTVTSFTQAADFINFASDTLIGSSAAVVAGAANTWNLNNAGVFISTNNTLTFVVGVNTAQSVANAIGNVVGDAGDTAYFVANDGTDSSIFAVTLGTTRTTASGLNAGDTITLLSQVDSGSILTAANFSFLG